MKFRLIHQNGARTYALIFNTSDEVVSGLTSFARDQGVKAGHFTAIGAFSDVTVAYFDWEKREYRDIPIPQQVEVLTLAGDIALKDGKPKVHAHVVVGKPDGSAHGGHLVQAHVRPTLEVILTEAPTTLQRVHDDSSGLALIDFR